jgi:hypothetical protein
MCSLCAIGAAQIFAKRIISLFCSDRWGSWKLWIGTSTWGGWIGPHLQCLQAQLQPCHHQLSIPTRVWLGLYWSLFHFEYWVTRLVGTLQMES